MEKTRLIVIRHGYSEFNKGQRFTGQIDVELDPIGVEQAEATAKYVLENYKVDAIYSSDLKRTYNTALPIARALGIKINTSRELRELNVGLWGGKTFAQVWEQFPESMAQYVKNCGLARCDGGESYAEFMDRCVNEFRRIALENCGKTVVIATHGGVIRCLRAAWNNIPLEELCRVEHVSNASVTVVEYGDGEARILLEGYCDHLENKTTERAVQ